MIQWYPGHMAKAKKEIEEKLKLVDIVYELIDARIPFSSRNPMVNEILKNKPRLVLMTKSNMADSNLTKKWENFFKNNGQNVLSIDSTDGFNIKKRNILFIVNKNHLTVSIYFVYISTILLVVRLYLNLIFCYQI